MSSNDLRRQNYRQFPTPTLKSLKAHISHYPNESPAGAEAPDSPRHSSTKAENWNVGVILYTVYGPSWLGFFSRLRTLLSLKQNKTVMHEVKDRWHLERWAKLVCPRSAGLPIIVRVRENHHLGWTNLLLGTWGVTLCKGCARRLRSWANPATTDVSLLSGSRYWSPGTWGEAFTQRTEAAKKTRPLSLQLFQLRLVRATPRCSLSVRCHRKVL